MYLYRYLTAVILEAISTLMWASYLAHSQGLYGTTHSLVKMCPSRSATAPGRRLYTGYPSSLNLDSDVYGRGYLDLHLLLTMHTLPGFTDPQGPCSMELVTVSQRRGCSSRFGSSAHTMESMSDGVLGTCRGWRIRRI